MDLSMLDPLVEDKRFAFLGEVDHFVHEKYEYRMEMVRYLAARGFRWIGEELSWTDGTRIDSYLQTGDESWLDKVTTYGYRGDARTDRDDSPTGILADGIANYPTDALRHEQVRFARALRNLGATVRFFGFDVDYWPQAAYAHLDDPAFDRVPGETLAEEIARIERTLAASENTAATSLLHGLRYIEMAHPATTYDELAPAMAYRERVMREQLMRVVEDAGPDARFVLMAHNQHLAKDDSAIRSSGGVGPGGDTEPAIGTWIARRFPGEVFGMWLLHYEGTDSQPFASLPNDLRAPRGSLNAKLAKLGDRFVVPAVLFAGEQAVAGMYNAVIHTDVSRQADAIWFVRDASPLRK